MNDRERLAMEETRDRVQNVVLACWLPAEMVDASIAGYRRVFTALTARRLDVWPPDDVATHLGKAIRFTWIKESEDTTFDLVVFGAAKIGIWFNVYNGETGVSILFEGCENPTIDLLALMWERFLTWDHVGVE